MIYENDRVRVYDDFAHHPTAINETLNGLRNSVGEQTIFAVLEPRSNTMKQGVHKDLLADSLQSANNSMVFADSTVSWDINSISNDKISTYSSTEKLLETLLEAINSNTEFINVIIMSNGGFENLHQRLIKKLS